MDAHQLFQMRGAVCLKDSVIMQGCGKIDHIPSFTQLFADHVTTFESFQF